MYYLLSSLSTGCTATQKLYCGNGPHSAESKGTDSIHIRIPRRIPVMNMIVQITIDIVC